MQDFFVLVGQPQHFGVGVLFLIYLDTIALLLYLDSMTTYTLTLTEDQARALSNAAELVSRLHMGQLDCLGRFNKYPDNFEGVYRLLDQLREEMNLIPDGCGKNAYYGITSEEISNEARTLFDAHQVIRHELWKNQEDAPNYITHASTAMQTDHTQHLPKIQTNS